MDSSLTVTLYVDDPSDLSLENARMVFAFIRQCGRLAHLSLTWKGLCLQSIPSHVADLHRILDSLEVSRFPNLKILQGDSATCCALFLRCPSLQELRVRDDIDWFLETSNVEARDFLTRNLGTGENPSLRILEAGLPIGLNVFSRCPALEKLYLHDHLHASRHEDDAEQGYAHSILRGLHLYELPKLRVLEASFNIGQIISRNCPALKQMRYSRQESSQGNIIEQLSRVSTDAKPAVLRISPLLNENELHGEMTVTYAMRIGGLTLSAVATFLPALPRLVFTPDRHYLFGIKIRVCECNRDITQHKA